MSTSVESVRLLVQNHLGPMAASSDLFCIVNTLSGVASQIAKRRVYEEQARTSGRINQKNQTLLTVSKLHIYMPLPR